MVRITMNAGLSARTWLAAAGLALSLPAQAAGCYDAFGCTDRSVFRFQDLMGGPNCEFLYEMRNQIYKEHGYCFRTQRAINQMGNEGCSITDMARVPLSSIERGNATTILRAEQAKGCPE